jgi:hypothetical protein
VPRPCRPNDPAHTVEALSHSPHCGVTLAKLSMRHAQVADQSRGLDDPWPVIVLFAIALQNTDIAAQTAVLANLDVMRACLQPAGTIVPRLPQTLPHLFPLAHSKAQWRSPTRIAIDLHVVRLAVRASERNFALPDISDRRLPVVIATSFAKVLRQPVEAALTSSCILEYRSLYCPPNDAGGREHFKFSTCHP